MTTKHFEAVYEGGVLRPLEALDLEEHQRVLVVLAAANGTEQESWLDTECVELCAREADDSISLDAVRQALSKIPGSMTADFAEEREER